MLRKILASFSARDIGKLWPIQSYTGDYAQERDALVAAFQEIAPHLKTSEQDTERIAFLKNLSANIKLGGTTVFYPAGGNDAITAFLLNPQATKVIIVDLGHTYNLTNLKPSSLVSDFTLANTSFFRTHGSYSMKLERFEDFSINGFSLNYSEQKRNNLLLTNLVRMYLLDGLLLRNIIPFALGFKMVYSNQQTVKTIEYIPSDYSSINQRNRDINTYIRKHAGLRSVIIKASLDLFIPYGSRGYDNLYNTIRGLPGKILCDRSAIATLFCPNPTMLDLGNDYFGYSNTACLCDFSQLKPL